MLFIILKISYVIYNSCRCCKELGSLVEQEKVNVFKLESEG